MKMKLTQLNFRALFLNHVEKAVLIVAGVCLLMFIVSALGREKLPPEREPDQLSIESKHTRDHVEKSDFETERAKIRPPDAPVYKDRVQRDSVQLAIYDTHVDLNPPIVEAKVLREEPPYLPVTELQVGMGFAPFAILDPKSLEGKQKLPRPPRPGIGEEAGGSTRKPRFLPFPPRLDIGEELAGERDVRVVDRQNREGVRVGMADKLVVKYWAMVTGLVPVRAQKKAYGEVFENAASYDPEQDLPKYLGYIIERAEVTSGDMQNLQWTVVKKDESFMNEWTDEMAETVMSEFVHPTFVMPLGPRVGTNWEPYVGHPKIPFEPTRNQLHGGGPMGPERGRMGPERGAMGPMRGNGFRGGFEQRMAVDPRGGFASGEEEEEASGFDEGGRRRIEQGVEEESPEERRRKLEVVALIRERQIIGVDHMLFRFCDFTVEPGKQYVYRVKLGLVNPNRGIPVKYLKRRELADPKPKTTDYSEISPIAAIPFGDKILAGSVTPPTVIKEPTVDVRIVQVKKNVEAEVPMSGPLLRGAKANFLGKTTQFIDPRTNEVTEYKGDFETDAVVLDMRGGRPVLIKDKTMTEPGELLVLDRTGKLTAMHEFDDEDTWKNYIVPEEKEHRGMPDGMDLPFRPMGPEGMRVAPSPRGKRSVKPTPQSDVLDGGSPIAPKHPPGKPFRPKAGDR